MQISYLILAIILLIFVGVLIAAFLTYPRPDPNPLVQSTLFENSLQKGWCTGSQDPPCNGQPVSGSRGSCNLYTTLTTNSAVVDNLVPTPLSAAAGQLICDDGFTKALTKNTRVCSATECIGQDGKIYTQGQQETLYVQCASLNKCPSTFRNAVVFNYYVDPATQKLSPKAASLIGNVDAPFQVELSSVAQKGALLESSPYIIMDQTILASDASGNPIMYFTSLRSPDQVNCLDIDTKTVPCSQVAESGQVWLYLPDLCQTVTSNGQVILSGCYPQQLITRPTDADMAVLKNAIASGNVAYIASVLAPYKTLSFSYSTLITVPYTSTFCQNYTGIGKLKDDTCVYRTDVLTPQEFVTL